MQKVSYSSKRWISKTKEQDPDLLMVMSRDCCCLFTSKNFKAREPREAFKVASNHVVAILSHRNLTEHILSNIYIPIV
jgi:hypothetical protein